VRRIAVVGTSCSGKTTLSRRLAERFGCPHVELDAIHWGPNWTEVPPEVFRERALTALSGETWVADGNYSRREQTILRLVDTVVWLDYPLIVVLWRAFARSLRRVVRREELWHGNRETLRGHLSRDSMVLWVLQTHRRRRRQYAALAADPDCAHLHVVRLRSQAQTNRWLASLDGPASPSMLYQHHKG
jgi:adenylate kinase family enzyme